MQSNHQVFLIELGKRIKARRIEMGMSQRLMASNLDIDERHLRRIEKGETNPTILLLLEIAMFLELDMTEIVDSPKMTPG